MSDTSISSSRGEAVPLDAELQVGLAAMSNRPPTSVTADMISSRREVAAAASPTDDEIRRASGYSVEERVAPGQDGDPPVRLVVCRPQPSTSLVPVLYYVHGGGMFAGTARTSLLRVVATACDVGAAVVSVEYRLAPEHPDPAPRHDVFSGLCWIAEHAASLGMDPTRCVVVGSSAGGGLAAGAVLMARDRGAHKVAGQMLLSPMLDDRNDTHSSQQMVGIGVWDRVSNNTGWTALLGSRRGGRGVTAYTAPARATDLSNLPPTLVDVGSAETFRDEAIAYATGVWAQGGRAELHVWSGGFHGFDNSLPDTQLARDARTARVRWLTRLLAEQQEGQTASLATGAVT